MTSKDAPIARPLETIRAELDDIDERIFTLVVRRAALADEVRRAKTDTGVAALRPAREAQMLRRFAGFASGAMRLEQIWRLWRELIMANARLQFPFTVDTVAASRDLDLWDMGRAHFCFETGMEAHPDARAALASAASGPARVALLPAADASWWGEVGSGAGGMRVFGSLPMIVGEASEAPRALIVGNVAVSPSGDDVTVLRLERAGAPLDRAAIAAALAPAGHCLVWSIEADGSALAGIAGLADQAMSAPAPFAVVGAGMAATVIGAHAAPVVLAGGAAR